jgi:hypothetical protein
MAKRSKKLLDNKWIKWGIIPILLLGFWFVLTYWYIIKYDQSFMILSYNHNESNFESITHNRLLEGEKLTGEFVAPADNLGIVAMRFKSFQRIPYRNEDNLVFRIKEKGEAQWYYENDYRSGFVYDVPFLPFGFPVIANSIGKTYVFELESLKGNQVNGVALSSRDPFLVTKYQANANELKNDYIALITFAWKKFLNSFSTIDIAYSSFVFSLPLLTYLFWRSPVKGKTINTFSIFVDRYGNKVLGKKYRYFENSSEDFVSYYVYYLIIAVILIDIVILQVYNDLLYIVIGGIWLFLTKQSKLDGKYSVIVGLLLLCLAPVYLQLNVTNTAEKSAAWAFILIVVGMISTILSARTDVLKQRRTIKTK